MYKRQESDNGDCGTDGKCDRRWRDEDSTLDNGITVIRIVSCIYSADPLFLQTEERQRVRRRREDEQNKTDVYKRQGQDIVIEKECPSCGANYVPDEKGCCSYCGYSLKVDNSKWKINASEKRNMSTIV